MPTLTHRLRPIWDGQERSIACHRANLNDEQVPNSLDAVAACVAADAPRIEVDLRFLADGTMVVYHDAELDKESTGAGELSRLTCEDLRGLTYRRAPHPPIARFEEVVDAVTGSSVMLQVDLKERAPLESSQLAAIEHALGPIATHCIVGTGFYQNLVPIAQRGLRVALDSTPQWHYWPGRSVVGDITPLRMGLHGLWDDSPVAHTPSVDPEDYVASRVEEITALVPVVSEWMVDLHTLRHIEQLHVRLGHLLHERGIELAAWTLRDHGREATRDRMVELFELGADTVIADSAETVASYLDPAV